MVADIILLSLKIANATVQLCVINSPFRFEPLVFLSFHFVALSKEQHKLITVHSFFRHLLLHKTNTYSKNGRSYAVRRVRTFVCEQSVSPFSVFFFFLAFASKKIIHFCSIRSFNFRFSFFIFPFALLPQ